MPLHYCPTPGCNYADSLLFNYNRHLDSCVYKKTQECECKAKISIQVGGKPIFF